MSSAIHELPCSALTVADTNIREDPGDLSELVSSIRSVGVLVPLVVVPGPDGEGRVIAGFRRLAAARQAGIAKVPCVVLRNLSRPGEIAISFVENYHRKQASPIEEGKGIRGLVEGGMSRADVARALGMSEAVVRGRLALISTLVPAAQTFVHKGLMTIERANLLMTLPREMQERLCQLGVPSERDIAKALCAETGRVRAHHHMSRLEQDLAATARFVRAERWSEALELIDEVRAVLSEAVDRTQGFHGSEVA